MKAKPHLATTVQQQGQVGQVLSTSQHVSGDVSAVCLELTCLLAGDNARQSGTGKSG